MILRHQKLNTSLRHQPRHVSEITEQCGSILSKIFCFMANPLSGFAEFFFDFFLGWRTVGIFDLCVIRNFRSDFLKATMHQETELFVTLKVKYLKTYPFNLSKSSPKDDQIQWDERQLCLRNKTVAKTFPWLVSEVDISNLKFATSSQFS